MITVGTPSNLRWVSGSAKEKERRKEGGSRGKSKRTQLESLDAELKLTLYTTRCGYAYLGNISYYCLIRCGPHTVCAASRSYETSKKNK